MQRHAIASRAAQFPWRDRSVVRPERRRFLSSFAGVKGKRDCEDDQNRGGEIDVGIVEMNRSIGDWLGEINWRQRHREVRRFLRTWSFTISEPGLVYARAEGNTLAPRELDMFLSRLEMISDETFPSMVTLDMTGASITPRHWEVMQKALARFASSIQAYVISDLLGESRKNYAMIWR
jgi:hypothetical protein